MTGKNIKMREKIKSELNTIELWLLISSNEATNEEELEPKVSIELNIELHSRSKINKN